MNTSKIAAHESLIQVIEGIGCIVAEGNDAADLVENIAQWRPAADGQTYCELQAQGECDPGEVIWGTSSPFEPTFCTRHFFDGSTGYEFVDSESDKGRDKYHAA
jgi:hypothetical protein